MAEATVDEKKSDEIKKEEKQQEDWMTKKWRPMMAMMYMTCCLADFAIFPIMFTIVQFWETQAANDAFRQWVPITLQGGGLFHVAMGAVLGVSAFGRTQEKIAGAAGGAPAGLPTQPLTPTSQPTSPPIQGGMLPQQQPGMMSGGIMPAQQNMQMSMAPRPQEPEPLGKGGMPLVKPGAYD